jgi:tripartite-type tricarboxylate transporter receptor subunit TctC
MIAMRKTVAFFLVLSFILSVPLMVFAQGDAKAKLKAIKPKDFPTQPIEFVVVYAPGGSADLAARILAKYVEKYIENRCVVVNKTGGGGLIGHTYLATQAKNDGYTVGVLTHSYMTDEILKAKGKWSYRNLDAIGYMHVDNCTWIINTAGALKDRSIKDVIAMAKQDPGKIKVAIVPEMTFEFLAENVEMSTGAKFIHVPFQGAGPSNVALLGGHVDISTSFYAEYKSQLEAGKVKVLAVSGMKRLAYLPDVLTFNEALGVKDILWSTWRFVFVPKGTPADRSRYLEAAVDAALHDPECIKELDGMGIKVGEKYMTAKESQEEVGRLYETFKDFFTKTGRISK